MVIDISHLTCHSCFYLGLNISAQFNEQDLDNVTWVRAPRQILTRGIFRVTEDTRISTAPLVLLKRRDFSLYIRPVLFDDRGEYRCAIVFKDRVHIRTVELRVLVPPRITRSPVSFLKVDEGASLEMDCLASGYPVPETTWLVRSTKSSSTSSVSSSSSSTFDDNGVENAMTVMDAFAKFGGSRLIIYPSKLTKPYSSGSWDLHIFSHDLPPMEGSFKE
ncbi:unnamed protein product [Echinostoma caproni]|uniref:Ig-like domain-containing protein n=1 Tax=Echinostoma caproni TaxID=27848 RepID=A0A183AGN2_9TREM|nr:unnamed protein product [Echinostoma caproni]